MHLDIDRSFVEYDTRLLLLVLFGVGVFFVSWQRKWSHLHPSVSDARAHREPETGHLRDALSLSLSRRFFFAATSLRCHH